jgi:hypothetical protein
LDATASACAHVGGGCRRASRGWRRGPSVGGRGHDRGGGGCRGEHHGGGDGVVDGRGDVRRGQGPWGGGCCGGIHALPSTKSRVGARMAGAAAGASWMRPFHRRIARRGEDRGVGAAAGAFAPFHRRRAEWERG